MLELWSILYVALLAQEGPQLAQATATADWVDAAKTLGVPAICLAALFWAMLKGKIRTEAEVIGLQTDKAKLQAQVDELLGIYRDQALPALLASSEALRGSANQVAGLTSTLQRVEDSVDRMNVELRRRGA